MCANPRPSVAVLWVRLGNSPCCLVVWAKSELTYFVGQFSAQVFQSNVDLSDQAECFQSAIQCAQKVNFINSCHPMRILKGLYHLRLPEHAKFNN